jgi:hypothetical protein
MRARGRYLDSHGALDGSSRPGPLLRSCHRRWHHADTDTDTDTDADTNADTDAVPVIA